MLPPLQTSFRLLVHNSNAARRKDGPVVKLLALNLGATALLLASWATQSLSETHEENMFVTGSICNSPNINVANITVVW